MTTAFPSTTSKAIAWRFVVVGVVSLVGLADSLYLTIQDITGANLRCTFISGCAEVLSSPYSHIGRMPLAVLGAITYFTVFSLAILAAFGYQIARKPLAALTAV